jgi:hypothetical protein
MLHVDSGVTAWKNNSGEPFREHSGFLKLKLTGGSRGGEPGSRR